jgi:hypothetical protein
MTPITFLIDLDQADYEVKINEFIKFNTRIGGD